VAQSLPIHSLASVASFFVSRVDTDVDARLNAIIQQGGAAAEKAKGLMGKAAIANARLAYAEYKKSIATPRFKALLAKGARVQRPLWASTSTKNPAYRDVLYVEELIGADTVDTVPPQTLADFLDHGRVRNSLEEDLDGARETLAELETLGISMKEVTDQLEEEGVKAFADSFSVVMDAVEKRRQAVP